MRSQCALICALASLPLPPIIVIKTRALVFWVCEPTRGCYAMLQGNADNAPSISNVQSSASQSDDGHDRIEYDESLTFATYNELTKAVVAYATSHCFEIRLTTGSAITSNNHYGCFRCWCYKPPLNSNQPLPVDTTERKRKRKRAKSMSKEHAMSVGCRVGNVCQKAE